MENYFDRAEKNPRYAPAKKLVDILEAIARCETRVNERYDVCKRISGWVSGPVMGSGRDEKYILKYLAIAKRLKQYYNNQLLKLQPYEKQKPVNTYLVYMPTEFGLGWQPVKAKSKAEARQKFRKRYPKKTILSVEVTENKYLTAQAI